MPPAMQYGLWGLMGSLVLSIILYFAGIVPVFLATFGILAIAIAVVVAVHVLGTHHWPATIPLVAIAVTFLAVVGIQTYLAYQPRTQDALERQRESVDTSNAAQLTPVGLRQRQALLVHCTRLDEAVGARIAAEAALIQVPATKGLGDAIRDVGKGLSRLEQRARENSSVIARCLNEARGKTWWDTVKGNLPNFSQAGTAGGLIALGLLLLGIGFAMSKVKIGPAWIASTLGGLALIVGLVWLFFGADIARAVADSESGRGATRSINGPPPLPFNPKETVVQSGAGNCTEVWMRGNEEEGVPVGTLAPGQTARIRYLGGRITYNNRGESWPHWGGDYYLQEWKTHFRYHDREGVVGHAIVGVLGELGSPATIASFKRNQNEFTIANSEPSPLPLLLYYHDILEYYAQNGWEGSRVKLEVCVLSTTARLNGTP